MTSEFRRHGIFGPDDIQALSRIFQRLHGHAAIDAEELARLVIEEYAANPPDDDTLWRNCIVAVNRRAIHHSFLKASPLRKAAVGARSEA